MKYLRQTPSFKRGRLGEILQIGIYRNLGVRLIDLADRTEKRAPLLYGPNAELISPDTLGRKTADFWLEFKTKAHAEQWRGGCRDDPNPVPARMEQGIDDWNYRSYIRAGEEWCRPVVLSILSIKEATLWAATLEQLGEPRESPPGSFTPMVNWDVRDFSVLATFDPERLDQFFNDPNPENAAGRERWLKEMPNPQAISAMLKWLSTKQPEFAGFRQHLFDLIERQWHHRAA